MMLSKDSAMTLSLFDDENIEPRRKEDLVPGAFVLHGFALADEAGHLDALRHVTARSPFRHMVTPGGFRMSVAMTNCGSLGWITDRTGYRYDAIDPESGQDWPPMLSYHIRSVPVLSTIEMSPGCGLARLGRRA
jgi:alkylated DNA repair protein (DNA oxidative demethylase)